jgi:hypothetical protein
MLNVGPYQVFTRMNREQWFHHLSFGERFRSAVAVSHPLE